MSDSNQKLLIYFEYLLKFADNLTIITDSNFNILDSNDLALQKYGYTSNEFLELSFLDLITHDLTAEIKIKEKNPATKYSLNFITTNRTKQGTYFSADVSLHLINVEGKRYYEIVVKVDNNQDKLEVNLFEEREQLRTIIDASPASIWFKDTKNNFIRVNKAAAKIANKNVDEVEGKPTGLIFPLESDKYYADDLEVIASGIPKLGIIESVTTGTNTRWVRTDKIPWLNVRGEIAGIIAFAIDITEQKQAAEQLSRKSALLNSLIENIPDLIYAKDLESKFIIYNNALALRWGIPNLNVLIGKSDFDLFPYELAKQFRAEEQEIISTGKPIFNHEESMRHANGQTIWGLTTKTPLKDDQGNIIGIVGLSRDVTELKRIEEKVYHEHNLLRTLIDNLPDAVYSKDNEYRKILVNKADLDNMGCNKEEEALGKTDFDLFPREVATQFYKDDQKVLIDGQPVIDREEYFIDKNGNRRWLLTSKIPLFDGDRNIIGLLGIGHDITKRKLAEEALRASEEKYRSVFTTAPLGIAHINFDFEITDCNYMLLDILDIPEKESIGFDFKNIKDHKFQYAIELAFEGSISFYEGDYQSALTQKVISLKATFSPIIQNKEKILSVVGIFEDISERKQIERFFFHDILNTAGNLRNYAEIHKDDLIENMISESLVADGMHLVAISNKMIQEIISHRSILTSDKTDIKVNLASINSLEFVSKLIEDISQSAVKEDKSMTLSNNFEDITFQTDRILLGRVIENLIKNAIEASLPGGIVSIGCLKKKEHIILWVNNQTCIPEEIKSKIFKRSFSTKGPGRGIGTYSIKFLTENYLKGRVSFTTNEHEGTTFNIIIPIDIQLSNNSNKQDP